MSRHPLTLARAKQLASKLVRDDDSNADILIELFSGALAAGDHATQQTIRTAILKTWYCATEDFRAHFREYIGDVVEEIEDQSAPLEEANAPAS